MGILFSTKVTTLVVARFVILGILFLASFILALAAKLVAKLVIIDILSLASFILALILADITDLLLVTATVSQ